MRGSKTDDPYEREIEDFLENEAFHVGEDKGKLYYTFGKRSIERLQKLGIGNLPRPKLERIHANIYGQTPGSYFDGRLPTTLKDLTLDEISSLHSLFGNFFGYLTQERVRVSAEMSEWRRKAKLMESMIRGLNFKAAKSLNLSFPPTQCSDATRCDERFVQPDSIFEELNIIHSGLEAMIKVTEQNMKILSREITIREAKVEAEARGRGMGSRFRSREVETEPQRALLPSEKRRAQNARTQSGPKKASKRSRKNRKRRDLRG